MKADPLTLGRGRLKCDACGHTENVGHVSPAHIGTACPACGANMLTEEDYRAALRLLATVQILNAEIGPVDEGPRSLDFSVNPRGDDDPVTLLCAGLGGAA